MTFMLTIGLLLYLLAVAGLVAHSLFFVPLFLSHRRRGRTALPPTDRFATQDLPFQIVQLPVYNEDPALVRQLVDCAGGLSYPKDRLLIQLLDDSDREEIRGALRQMVAEHRQRAPETPLRYYHRQNRRDFKAGNLNFGLEEARRQVLDPGKWPLERVIVSIFDADFIVPIDYLQETVHHFTAGRVGAVQAELDYYNRRVNLLTAAQASFLNNLHAIEFGARSRAGHLTTCRGAAVSWRLSAIRQSGGWKGDTQVEDVDMSMAIQLAGFRIVYLNTVSAACQLPTGYNEFKLQQRSWVKGLMEVAKKHLGAILHSPTFDGRQKIVAMDFFLILTLQPLFMIVGHLALIPAYYFFARHGLSHLPAAITVTLLLLLSVTHLSFLGTGGKRPPTGRRSPGGLSARAIEKIHAVWLVPSLFAALTYGLVEGLIGVPVYRGKTRKSGPAGDAAASGPDPVRRRLLHRIGIFESFMGLYSLVFVAWAIAVDEPVLAAVYGTLAVCYPWGGLRSWMDAHRDHRRQPPGWGRR